MTVPDQAPATITNPELVNPDSESAAAPAAEPDPAAQPADQAASTIDPNASTAP